MENRNVGKYFIGLDIGTNSVGWAATNDNYSLLRLKGKDAWGSSLFQEGSTAAERRMFRASKRRVERRKYRLKLLQEIFKDEMQKKDSSFFIRLNESMLHLEDRPSEMTYKSTLFLDNFKEKEYYKQYPTIWHLRKALIDGNSKAYSDIRYLYLAIHHIIKYRGNFLKEGQAFNDSFDEKTIENINKFFIDREDTEEDVLDVKDKKKLEKILLDEKTNKKEKIKKIKEIIFVNDKDIQNIISSLIVGGTCNFKKIINSEEDIKINFSENSDEKLLQLYSEIGDYSDLVSELKEIYDASVLQKLLKDYKYISESMISIYENHKKQLKDLKEKIIKTDKKLSLDGNSRYYYKIFKDKSSESNYCCFTHNGSNKKRCKIDEFNKFMIEQITEIKKVVNDINWENILNECEENKYMSIIALNSTSIIPYQLHEMELKKIIENAKNFYPNIDYSKIHKLLLFRVPYYVGPLNDKSNHAWLVRNSNEKITPWDFERIVDIKKTRVNFINNLTNKCLYLIGEDVLPKSSLLYQKYMVLDKINCIKINGEKISQENKELIYDLCKKTKKVTKKKIIECLKENNRIEIDEKVIIEGIDDELTSGLDSYIDFLKVGFIIEKPENGKIDVKNNQIKVIEEIIKLSTIYTDNKDSIKEIILEKYPSLDENKLKKALQIKVGGYGAFSYAFLNKIFCFDENGEAKTIIKLLEDTTENLQQILFNPKYNFKQIILDYNKGKSLSDNEIIEEKKMALSPMSRKSVNQGLKIIDEIIKIKKTVPEKIFIETMRHEGKKERTKSKKNAIKAFINSILSDKKILDNDFKESVEECKKELEKESITNERLNGKALYLYFIQMGYDLYTSKKINIEDVIDSTKYDVDHLIPQSKIKDDSMDNLILTCRTINQKDKGDIYPLSLVIKEETYKKCERIWGMLYKYKLISSKKYANLTRKTELTEEELNDFVNRQLVSVNYSNKVLKDILEIKYKNSKIIFSKASFVSDFRKDNNIYKIRELNDLHHAVDAYLNIVVGNVIWREYTSNIRKRVKEMVDNPSSNYSLNFMRVFSRNTQNLWNEEIKEKVLKIAKSNSQLLVYKPENDKYNLYKQTLYSANSSSNLLPIHTSSKDERLVKMSDVSKYGGYNSLSFSHLCVIKGCKGGKEIKYLYPVSLVDSIRAESTGESLAKIIEEKEGLTDVVITKGMERILFYSEFRIGKSNFLITGRSNNTLLQCKFNPLIIKQKSIEIMKTNQRFKKMVINIDAKIDSISFNVNKDGGIKELSKSNNLNVFDEIVSKSNSPIYFAYQNILSTLSNVKDRRGFFEEQSIYNQIVILEKLLILLSNTSAKSDLTLLNKEGEHTMKGFSGGISLDINISNIDIYWVQKSVTGLFGKEVKL
ncbi:MAG: type II CRISPR RNA-guided endonuclease Cas9 [Bacilli bacterium]